MVFDPNDGPARRSDLQALRAELIGEVSALRAELRSEILGLRSDTEFGLASLETRLIAVNVATALGVAGLVVGVLKLA
jgi:hypothetical protein